MTFLRYRVADLPTRGAGAFCPTLVTTPHASSGGLELVAGAPGTMPIPAPKPAALAPFGLDPKTQGSNVSPDVITPAVYVASPDNMHPPVPVRHHNVLPIPARGWARSPGQAFRDPSRIGGRRVVPWPRSFQRWGSVTRTAGG